MNNISILTNDDVKIDRWRWWSKWIDVAACNYDGAGFLLQMKISRTNSKRFKTISLKSTLGAAYFNTTSIGDLVQMSASPVKAS